MRKQCVEPGEGNKTNKLSCVVFLKKRSRKTTGRQRSVTCCSKFIIRRQKSDRKKTLNTDVNKLHFTFIHMQDAPRDLNSPRGNTTLRGPKKLMIERTNSDQMSCDLLLSVCNLSFMLLRVLFSSICVNLFQTLI